MDFYYKEYAGKDVDIVLTTREFTRMLRETHLRPEVLTDRKPDSLMQEWTGAGVIFAPVSTNYAQLIIEAASAQGYEGSLLGSDTWDNNKVAESTVGKNVSVEVTTFYQEGGDPDFDAGIKEWINANDGDRSIFSFVRKSPTRRNNILIVCNFTPI